MLLRFFQFLYSIYMLRNNLTDSYKEFFTYFWLYYVGGSDFSLFPQQSEINIVPSVCPVFSVLTCAHPSRMNPVDFLEETRVLTMRCSPEDVRVHPRRIHGHALQCSPKQGASSCPSLCKRCPPTPRPPTPPTLGILMIAHRRALRA